MVFSAFKAAQDALQNSNVTNTATRANAIIPASSRVASIPPRRRADAGSIQIIDPSAYKSADLFSRDALDFINNNSNIVGRYSEQQLLGAYMTSVYMYAALRRVSNLISRIRIVAEQQQEDQWVRLPSTDPLNSMLQRDGGEAMSRMWLNFAIYGSTAVYKVKTRKAVLEERGAEPVYGWKDGAVAGLYVLDKPLWDLDQDYSYNTVQGLNVYQYGGLNDIMGDRNYLSREEFIYYVDWNPEDPNRGHSLVSVAIHEAVANASIAQWMAEYFTRGAMPFIMVSMEEDPELITDSDLLKYKKQFEEYWQGLGASLRSVFLDRRVNVEQVGIAAGDVAAPDLNEVALEGIATTVGLDRELIVTPSGGSQERHNVLVKRAWEDTVIPIAKKFLRAFNQDLGLSSDVRLVLDLSDIAELDADRSERSSTEISIYESGLQSYNETRTRINMPPVEALEGYINLDGRPIPLERFLQEADLPSERLVEYALSMWDSNLFKRSQVLEILGFALPSSDFDGYKMDVEGQYDFVQGLWGDDLLRRSEVLKKFGYAIPSDAEDGYKSELERGADYGEWITGLYADNLLTRSQTIKLLDMGIEIPDNFIDGYATDVEERRNNILELWGENLLTRSQVLNRIGIEDVPDNYIDGYQAEVEQTLDRNSEADETFYSRVMELWDNNMLTRGQVTKLLQISTPENMIDGYVDQVSALTEQDNNKDTTTYERTLELWGENLLTKRAVLQRIGVTDFPEDAFDGYQVEVESLIEASVDAEAEKLSSYIEMEPRVEYSVLGKPESSPEELVEVVEAPPDEEAMQADVITNNVLTLEDADDDWSNLRTDLYNDDSVQGEEEWYYDNLPDNNWEDLEQMYADEDVDTLESQFMPEAESIPYNVDLMPETTLYTDKDNPYDYYEDSAIGSDDIGVYDWSDYIDESTITQIEEDVINRLSSPQTVDIKDVDASTERVIETSVLDEPRDVFVSLWFGNDNQLIQTQNDMKLQSDANWDDPNHFHITLTYAYNVTDNQLNKIIELMPRAINPFLVEVDGIDIFDNDNEDVWFMAVNLSDELEQLQRRVTMPFEAYGTGLSEYSYAHNYTPHITMGYADKGANAPINNQSYYVRPQYVMIGRDDYEVVHKIPIGYDSDPVFTNDSEQAKRIKQVMILDAWRRGKQKTNNVKVSIKSVWPGVFSAISPYVNVNNTKAIPDTVHNITAQAILDGTLNNDIDSLSVDMNANVKSIQKNAWQEAVTWKKVAKKNRTKAISFEVHHINRSMEQQVKRKLKSDDSVSNVFDWLLERIGKNRG